MRGGAPAIGCKRKCAGEAPVTYNSERADTGAHSAKVKCVRSRILGTSGLRVSSIGLGTQTWAMGTSADEARRILDIFLDAGGSLIDVSPLHNSADASAMLGKIIRQRGVADELIISASSGFHPGLPVGRRVDCSRRAMLKDLDNTLAVLGVDYLDLWSPGYWDPYTPPAEIMETVELAISSGKVRYAGVRDYTGWQVAVTHAASARFQPIAAQREYSLLNRTAEDELLPACDYLGMGFIAGAPLAQGVLTGKYQQTIPADSRGASAHADAEVQDYLDSRGVTIVGALVTAAEGLGVTAAAAALAWAKSRPGVTSVLVGARNRDQFAEILAADALVLPEQICAALDDVSL